jgi:hypothetical protein
MHADIDMTRTGIWTHRDGNISNHGHFWIYRNTSPWLMGKWWLGTEPVYTHSGVSGKYMHVAFATIWFYFFSLGGLFYLYVQMNLSTRARQRYNIWKVYSCDKSEKMLREDWRNWSRLISTCNGSNWSCMGRGGEVIIINVYRSVKNHDIQKGHMYREKGNIIDNFGRY